MTGNDSNSQLLSNRLSRFLYNKLDWIDLNPIQKNALPIIKERNDTLVIAPTASGKTEAYYSPSLMILLLIISNPLV
jgi:ATP-dependent Lhr-like helicase